MDKPDQMTVAELKVILSHYPDDEKVFLSSDSASYSYGYFHVGETLVMEYSEYEDNRTYLDAMRKTNVSG